MSNQHQRSYRASPPPSPPHITRKRRPPPHQNDRNRSEPPNQNKNTLTLSDQIFMLFKHSKEMPLLYLIQKLTELNYDGNIGYELRHTSFLHIFPSPNGAIARISFRIDDICPQQLCSPMSAMQTMCTRLHYVNSHSLCDFYRYRNCAKQNCVRYHVPCKKLTDLFLSAILSIYYSKHTHLAFNGYYLNGIELYNTFTAMFPQDPSLDLDITAWRQMVDKYNKYYIDYAQQLSDSYCNTNGAEHAHIVLWRTEPHQQYWRVRMNCGLKFIINRMCSDYAHSNKQCVFSVSSFCAWDLCPYFHVTSRVYQMMRVDCSECFYGHCREMHQFKESDLAHALPQIGNTLVRWNGDIDYELNQIRHQKAMYLNLVDLNNEQYIMHTQWCSVLENMMHEMQHKQCNGNGHTMQHKQRHPDEVMDGGFHCDHDPIAPIVIEFGNNMNTASGIQLLSKIIHILSGFDETPIDIAIAGLEKYVILHYCVAVDGFGNFVTDFRRMFLNIPRKWCYNRQIRIAVKIMHHSLLSDQISFIIEFQNVNVFCSISMMQQWFHQLMTRYSKRMKYSRDFDMTEYMKFYSSSFHFIQRAAPQTATIFFRNRRFNAAICQKIEAVFHGTVHVRVDGDFYATQSGDGRKFIHYKPPIIWSLLENEHKLHLHYKQSEHIQMVKMLPVNHIQQPSSRAISAPTPQRRSSPPPMPLSHSTQHFINLTPPPMTPSESDQKYEYERTQNGEAALQNIQHAEKNGYNGDYSSSVTDNDHNNEDEKPPSTPPVVRNILSIELDYSSDSDDEEANKVLNEIYGEKTKNDIWHKLAYGKSEIGNLNTKNDKTFENEEWLRDICRYCFEAKWSTTHALECWMIPSGVWCER